MATPAQWAHLERTRAASADQWPDWCLVPSALAMEWARRSFGWDVGVAMGIPALTAIAAWRWGRNVLAVDPDLWAALAVTPLTDVPADTVLGLPAWGAYIAAPANPDGMLGAYVCLDVDHNADPVLLIVADFTDDRTTTVPINLNRPLDVAVAEAVDQAATSLDERRALPSDPTGHTVDDYRTQQLDSDALTATVGPIVAVVLYVCSQEPDLIDPTGRARQLRRPARPSVDHPVVWETGWRIGSQLREAKNRGGQTLGGSQAPPRAHIRGPHWHRYWAGPRSDPHVIVRWLHPILVGGNLEDLSTTVIEQN